MSKYNFKYLIDNDISLYCESEEEREQFSKALELNNIKRFAHQTLKPKGREFYFRISDGAVEFNYDAYGGEVITFKEWLKLGEEMTETHMLVDNIKQGIRDLLNRDSSAEMKQVLANFIKDFLNTEEELNLETHVGKVNDDRLYEFSDDGINWTNPQYLIFIREEACKYKKMTLKGNNIASFKYCRLYKEPVDEYMSEKEFFDFVLNNKIVTRYVDGQEWLLNQLLNNKCIESAVWTTPDKLDEPKKFYKKYL